MPDGLEGLLAGRTLVKRYEIGEVIGRGGFAVVYRATDVRLGREVAVKVITLTAGDEDAREELRQRLHREARAAAGLPHHPNLVTVHDVGTDPELGLDFLVMELLRGENLAEYLGREGRPPLNRALAILRGAAEGLAVGHRAGLVHRDVKPANLFLSAPHGDETGPHRVCVLDYGIAQVAVDDATMTRGEATPLSPAYASPEQLRGERDLPPSSDVFSLGVVGYQLLTGERPFSAGPGQAPTGWTVRRPLREANPEVPAEVEAVLMRAMAADAADRFPDADAFAGALDAALAAPGAGTAPLAVADAVPPPDDDRTMLAPPAAAPPPPRPAPPPAPRRRRAWPAVLIVALLLAGVAAWAALGGGGDGADTAVRVPADAVGEADETVDEEDGGGDAPPPVETTTGEIATTPGPEPAGPADGGSPAETGDPAPAGPLGSEPAPPSTDPATPPPATSQPSARPEPPTQEPREPQTPPAETPRTEPEPPRPTPPQPTPPDPTPPPVQPVIVQPRPAPPDTVRIGPPR